MKFHYTLTPDNMRAIYDIYMERPNVKLRIGLVSLLMGFAFSITYLLQPGPGDISYVEKLQTSAFRVGGMFVIGFLFGQSIHYLNLFRQRRRLKKYPPNKVNITLTNTLIRVQSASQDVELAPEKINEILLEKNYLFIFYKENKKRETIIITRQALEGSEAIFESIVHAWSDKFTDFSLYP